MSVFLRLLFEAVVAGSLMMALIEQQRLLALAFQHYILEYMYLITNLQRA
jgi:hypothetical protein